MLCLRSPVASSTGSSMEVRPILKTLAMEDVQPGHIFIGSNGIGMKVADASRRRLHVMLGPLGATPKVASAQEGEAVVSLGNDFIIRPSVAFADWSAEPGDGPVLAIAGDTW